MNPDLERRALTAAVRSLRAAPRREAQDHLSSDRLLAYHEGTLAAGEAEELREHLARCPDCARKGLDLASFARPELAGEVDRPAPKPDWGKTRQVLAHEGFFDDSRAASPKPGARRFMTLFAPRLAYAMAAAFFLSSAALTWRLATVQRTLAELTGPRANVRVVDLYPLGTGSQRDEGDKPKKDATATASEPLVLILNLLDPGSYPGYRVEVVESSVDTVTWASDRLVRGPEGDFTVLVSRLPAGAYRVRLFGVGVAGPDLLAEYALTLGAP